MLRDAHDLLDRVRADVSAAAWWETDDQPPADAWHPVTTRRSPAGDVLLVAMAEGTRHHACVLFPAGAGDGRETCITARRAGLEGCENPYLGHCRWRRGWRTCADRGVLAVAFLAEPGARAIRCARGGREIVVPVASSDAGRCVILDWNDPAPVDRFVGIDLAGGTAAPAVPFLPYTGPFLAACWQAYWDAFAEPEPACSLHAWIGFVFHELEDEAFRDTIFALLKHLDARTQGTALAQLGAGPIYASGHWFYDRLEQETDLPPENVFAALRLERPALLPADVAARYHRVMRALARRLGEDWPG